MSMIHGAANMGNMVGLQPTPGVNAVRGLTQGAESTRMTGMGSGSGLMQAMQSSLAQAGIRVTASPELAQASMRSFMPTLLGALHQVAATHHTDMQGLLQRIAATANANPTLQHSFQALMGALGVPNTPAALSAHNNPAALGNLLQAMANNLQGVSTIGSVVNTSV